MNDVKSKKIHLKVQSFTLHTYRQKLLREEKVAKVARFFLATLIQKLADIKCCEKSFSKKLRALNVARIHFSKQVASNKCRDEPF